MLYSVVSRPHTDTHGLRERGRVGVASGPRPTFVAQARDLSPDS